MESAFCKNCRSLLEPNPGNKLRYKCTKCGQITDADDISTLLTSEDLTASDRTDKFRHAISTTAFDPISSKKFVPEGCECGRTILSYQLLGDKKKSVTVCLCGKISND